MSVLLVDVDEGNNEGVCDDVLDMEKIITDLVKGSCFDCVLIDID
jgi:hypothetical protein